MKIQIMRIAHVVCTFPPYQGGIGNSVYNMAEALADLGHEVVVLTPDYKLPAEEEEFNGKFSVKRLKPLLVIGNAALLPQLFFNLKNFDIVHLHYPFYGAIKAVLLRKFLSGKKMKLVLHYHMDNRASGLKGAVFYLYKIIFLPLLARAAGMITCASLDYIKHSALAEYCLARPEKFRQILFGVNLEQFVTYYDNKNKQRQNKVILFVGGLDRAHSFKGLENLIKALARLKQDIKFSSATLNVVGRGGLKDYYQSLARGLGLAKAIFFHDDVGNSRLVDFYNYCDCLILPSTGQSEAFGLVLLEAMACSRPVITSNLPGVRSVFKNGRQGLLVKPNDIKDLTTKIKKILSEAKRADAMGQAGRELVEKKYTWDKVARRLDVIYHSLKYSPR